MGTTVDSAVHIWDTVAGLLLYTIPQHTLAAGRPSRYGYHDPTSADVFDLVARDDGSLVHVYQKLVRFLLSLPVRAGSTVLTLHRARVLCR